MKIIKYRGWKCKRSGGREMSRSGGREMSIGVQLSNT